MYVKTRWLTFSPAVVPRVRRYDAVHYLEEEHIHAVHGDVSSCHERCKYPRFRRRTVTSRAIDWTNPPDERFWQVYKTQPAAPTIASNTTNNNNNANNPEGRSDVQPHPAGVIDHRLKQQQPSACDGKKMNYLGGNGIKRHQLLAKRRKLFIARDTLVTARWVVFPRCLNCINFALNSWDFCVDHATNKASSISEWASTGTSLGRRASWVEIVNGNSTVRTDSRMRLL